MPNNKMNYRLEIYPVIDLEPNKILGYKWRLTNTKTNEIMCLSAEGYETPEKAYLSATQAKWIMMDEGMETVLISRSNEKLPDVDMQRVRQGAINILKTLKSVREMQSDD